VIFIVFRAVVLYFLQTVQSYFMDLSFVQLYYISYSLYNHTLWIFLSCSCIIFLTDCTITLYGFVFRAVVLYFLQLVQSHFMDLSFVQLYYISYSLYNHSLWICRSIVVYNHHILIFISLLLVKISFLTCICLRAGGLLVKFPPTVDVITRMHNTQHCKTKEP